MEALNSLLTMKMPAAPSAERVRHSKWRTRLMSLAVAAFLLAIHVRRVWRRRIARTFDAIPLPAMEDFSDRCQRSWLWWFFGAFALEPHEQLEIFERMGKPEYLKGRLMFMPMVMSTNKHDLTLASTRRKAAIVSVYQPFVGPQGILFSEGSRARKEKQMLMKGFNQDTYRLIYPVMVKTGQRLLRQLLERSSREGCFEIDRFATRTAFEAVAEACFSVEVYKEENHKISDSLKRLVEIPGSPLCMFPFGVELVYWWNRATIDAVRSFLEGIIVDRLASRDTSVQSAFAHSTVVSQSSSGIKGEEVVNPQENDNHSDLLDLVLTASMEVNGSIDHDWVSDQMRVLLIGGSDTTGRTLGWIFINLAARQDIQKKVKTELKRIQKDYGNESEFDQMHRLDYLDAFIREVLRMYSPIQAIPRRLDDGEKDFKGIPIPDPAGTCICFHTGFAHIRDDYFHDPKVFQPERWLEGGSADRRAFGAFSDGMRVCLGRNFALTAMKTIMVQILTRYDIVAMKGLEDFPRIGFDGQLAAPIGDFPLVLVKSEDAAP